jgi:hypothetical protein
MGTAYVFSPSQLGFYPVDLKDIYVAANTWPVDAVAISYEVWAQFAGASPPAGMKLGADNDGQPTWVPLSPPS